MPVLAQDMPYQSCPLLRAYYPLPTINKSSAAIEATSATFTKLFDSLVQTGCSDSFGCISPNTTSFTLALFTGDADATDDNFIFFEYSHIAPVYAAENNTIGLDTVLPTGTLSQVFTVYAWLIQMGDSHWDQPITAYLPELAMANTTGSLAVKWEDISIGSLAGHMSGIVRNCKLGLKKKMQYCEC